ncbi:MAG TPA: hypothetical protein VHG08_20895 [Longimicrobium sp.]|nr:hypothetical protein [Longimicrobium sp.]
MRVLWLLAAGLGLFAANGVEAQPARVERRGGAELQAAPGEPLTIPFRVTSLAAAPVRLPGRTVLPPGWSATGGGGGELAPGQGELRLVGVRVPAGAAAGRYLVRYHAGDGADSAAVVVPVRRELSVEPEGEPPTVAAGEEYALRFRVANRGNAPERLALHARDDRGTAARPDVPVLLLPPASERVVTVRGATDRRATAELRHQVTLHAAGEADSAAGRILVAVVPRGGGRTARRSLPAELRLRAADSLGAAGFALHAQGALDRAGRVRLQVEARTADPAGTPYRRQDEYRLRLDAPGLALRLGDDVYALSRLTEPGRYGFGGAAWLRRGVLSAGAMAARDRRGQGEPGFAGGFARLQGRRGRLGVVFAAPEDAPARWTVEAAASPGPLLSLEAEAAPGGAGKSGVLPRAVRAAGYARALSYEVLHQRGGATYGGTVSPDQDFASLAVRPWGDLSLSASVRRGGELPPPGAPAAPGTFRRAALGWGSRLSVEYRETGGGAPGGDVRAVRGRLGFPLLDRAWLHPAYEAGRLARSPGEAAAPFDVISLQATISAPGGASLWTHAQLRRGAVAGMEDGGREWSGALSAHLPVLRGTWVRVAGQGRWVGGRPPETQLDLSLEHALGGGHRVTLRGLADARPGGDRRPRGFVEYALPLAVPLPAAAGDQVVARVYDPATGRGIPGVVVRLGDRRAVTDRRGVAGFAGVAPGAYTLRTEPAAGPERVANREMPVPVTVGGRRPVRVEVGLELAGRLEGVVERVAAGAPADSAAPMAGVEVEISGPGGVRRLQTDAAGRFQASGLRPGWWRVRTAAGSLPRHHELQEHQMLLVPAGGAAQAWLRVVEKERPVQIIQSGELTVP